MVAFITFRTSRLTYFMPMFTLSTKKIFRLSSFIIYRSFIDDIEIYLIFHFFDISKDNYLNIDLMCSVDDSVENGGLGYIIIINPYTSLYIY